MPSSSVILLVADGVRPDSLAAAMDRGEAPALARLRAEGGLHTVTSVFPSVTGLAYTPFLMGRHPAPLGLPGLRWYDRDRTRCRPPHYTRSYIGHEMRHLDGDMPADAPTLFEMTGTDRTFAAMTMVGRGLGPKASVGRGLRWSVRAAQTHFRGDLAGWLAIDRDVAEEVAARIDREKPTFVLAALLGIDKASHAAGHDAPLVREAIRVVDAAAARIRADAERAGRWETTRLWIVSDHGHSPVRHHEDLAGLVKSWGHRTIAHPWIYSARTPDVAVMVSGNAMAHLYVELGRRRRPWWPELAPRWEGFAARLLARPSVDLLLLPHSPTSCEVRTADRGGAMVTWDGGRYGYAPSSGDPLGIGPVHGLDADASWEATRESDYPDALVQIALLAGASRSGELILSAARDWDYRAKYEPIPHVSSHGALHREHMLVPLLVDRPVAGTPRRTVDIMPSVAAALGLAIPAGVEGRSFV